MRANTGVRPIGQYVFVPRARTASELTGQLARVAIVLAIAGLGVVAGGIYIGLAMRNTMSDGDWVLATAGMLVLGLVSTGLGVFLHHMSSGPWRDQLRRP